MTDDNRVARSVAQDLRDLAQYGVAQITGRPDDTPGGKSGAQAEALVVSATLEALAMRLDDGASPPDLATTYVRAMSTLNALLIGVLVLGTSGDAARNAALQPIALEGLLEDVAEATRRKVNGSIP